MDIIDSHWSNYYVQGKDFKTISPETTQKIESIVPNSLPKTFLDIGCGTGQYCREMRKLGYNTTGIDLSETAIKLATSKAVGDQNQKYLHLNFENSSFENKFLLISTKFVYAFIQDKPAFLTKIAGLLDENGIFALITPSPEATPAEKQGITVNYDETLVQLSKLFTVKTFKESTSTYFICKKIYYF